MVCQQASYCRLKTTAFAKTLQKTDYTCIDLVVVLFTLFRNTLDPSLSASRKVVLNAFLSTLKHTQKLFLAMFPGFSLM